MEQLINFIIRPPRAEYDPNNDLLDQEFMLKGKRFQRKDIEILNSRGDVLKCSHYLPIVSPEGKPLPCVIYCHGNSGCRADASEAAIILLPSNITVFTLDFSGSGLSGGEHVSLGWYEKDDLKSVVDYLRADGNVSLIALWGRSMGAVTSLMYGVEDPSIAGMVLDSPFSDLVDLMMELVDTYKIRLPKFTVKFAIQYMRRAILKKAKFDIVELNTIKVAKSSFVPVLFGHATGDDFIQPHHSDCIYEAYMGDKNIIKFEGDHDSPRPQFYFDSINIFFHNVLHPPEDEVKGNFFDSSLDYLGKEIHGVGYEDNFLVAPQASSSTEEAINQLRSKRPMSRTEVPSDIPSTDKQCNSEDEATSTEHTSSSKVINFEFSNGHSYKPSLEDDHECVEYPLQHIEGLQCNVEEERMLMEAVKQNSHIMAFLQELDHLKIPFEDIKSATNNFAHQNLLGKGGFGPVYKGQLPSSTGSSESGTTVAVKRLDVKGGQGEREFLMEISMLVSYKHDNLVSLVGFSVQGNEKVLVYKHEDNGSLDNHLNSKNLTWDQRMRICVGAARGLNYLHNGVGKEHRVIHRDIKSSNILLDSNWDAKISDFGLSKIGPANQQFTFLVTNACGTLGYLDPQYISTGILTKESDVYSFGVVLFEVLCGRVAFITEYEDERKFISGLVKFHQKKGTLHNIILPNLLKQMKPGSLEVFTKIAFRCLNYDHKQRPTMDLIIKDLEIALDHQLIEGLPCNVEEEERMLMEAVLLSLQDKPQR